MIHVFRSAFRQKRKNDPRILFELSKLGKDSKSETYRNPRNSMKNGYFRPSDYQISVIFQDIGLKPCTLMHLTVLFHRDSDFWKIRKISSTLLFENNIFIDYFAKFTDLKNGNPRQQCDRHIHSQSPVKNLLALSFKLFA